MTKIDINHTPNKQNKTKKENNHKNDFTSERVLYSLDDKTMEMEEEKIFNNNFMELPDIEKNSIIKEIQKFLENENGNIIFINHIRSILVDRKNYNTFSPKSLEMIGFLDYLAKNNPEGLQNLYDKFLNTINKENSKK